MGLKHIVIEGQLRTFVDLKDAFNLLSWMFFLGICSFSMHSNGSFLLPIMLTSDPIERLLASRLLDKPLSSLYLCLSMAYTTKLDRRYQKWRVDISDLTEDEWEDCFCLGSYVTIMISARNRFIQLKFLHRIYFTL